MLAKKAFRHWRIGLLAAVVALLGLQQWRIASLNDDLAAAHFATESLRHQVTEDTQRLRAEALEAELTQLKAAQAAGAREAEVLEAQKQDAESLVAQLRRERERDGQEVYQCVDPASGAGVATPLDARITERLRRLEDGLNSGPSRPD